ncbi:MAG: rhomboid family intramembrane serine protease [Pirellulaceae bacterium]
MVLPIADDNSDVTIFPVVNLALIAINVLVFVLFQGMGYNTDFTMAWSMVPAEIVSGQDIVSDDSMIEVETEYGVEEVVRPGLRPTPVPVYLTILTAMFMHGGIAHLLGNMWFLWVFGDNIENDLGWLRYLIFYLTCGVLASGAHLLFNSSGEAAMIPCLGASGAISGVMGAYIVNHPGRRVTVLLGRAVVNVTGIIAVGIWFAFQLISGLGMLGGGGGGVAYGAHIGGFIAGAALIKPFMAGHPGTAPPPMNFHDGPGLRTR